MTEYDIELVLRAAGFAAWKHRDQRRKGSGVPYVNHPIGVARLLAETGAVTDPITIAAALLHDTVEDTDTTRDDLARGFGVEVADVVAEVSDDLRLPKAARKRAQIERAQHLSDRARLVKLADKLHNLSDLATSPPHSWSVERVRGYFCWAHAVVDAIGNANDSLWEALERVFASEMVVGGESVRAVPGDVREREVLLTAYLESMATPRHP